LGIHRRVVLGEARREGETRSVDGAVLDSSETLAEHSLNSHTDTIFAIRKLSPFPEAP
jgi:hypothetical protein